MGRTDVKRPSCALSLQPVVTPDLFLHPREAAHRLPQGPGTAGPGNILMGVGALF